MHHNNKCYESKEKESRASMNLPVQSNSQVYDNNNNKMNTIMFILLKNWGQVLMSLTSLAASSRWKAEKPVVNHTLKETRPIFLDEDLNFGNDFADTVLMGLDSLYADLNVNCPDDVTNLFDFKMWWFAPEDFFSTIFVPVA